MADDSTTDGPPPAIDLSDPLTRKRLYALATAARAVGDVGEKHLRVHSVDGASLAVFGLGVAETYQASSWMLGLLEPTPPEADA